ncbi:hypothetical protein ACF0H5_019189 [Mactra antiquata]
MADLTYLVKLLGILVLQASVIISKETVIEYDSDKKPCTYFEGKRTAMYEGGLVNCSWYASSSCCKRTEVTSVFSSNMLPLYEASQDCRNRINYMMCFFCSPDQYLWYKEDKVHVCETFCRSIYATCKDAIYNGTKLGDMYGNGTAICEAQNFKVVNSKYCFKYDPTVFDAATDIQCPSAFTIALLIFSGIIYRQFYSKL